MTAYREEKSVARLALGKVELRAADAVILCTLALFSLLALAGRASVSAWPLLVARHLLVGAAVVASAAAVPRIRRPVPAFLLRMATVTLSYAYLFGAVAPLQLILRGRFLDDAVLAFEEGLFGVQPTIWMERFTTPPLTEWMMFCYVIYIPLYPLLCAVFRVRRGEAAMEEYFFTLGLVNALCDIGFILFPVAGPMYWMPDRYRVALDGWAFTWVGELIRARAHFVGGSLPSPHAAAATVMWVMAWKHYRPAFWALSPVILSLYVSTFYGRYHYLTDAAAGIVAAALVVAVAPSLQRAWDQFAGHGGRG
jgi:membrane-associated phospholipid phosphatase